ncbi:MAG: PIN domain-containing protein [Thermoanaerobaculia bacterium]
MRQILVDTSALYALLVESDQAHTQAVRAFEQLARREDALVTTSYVLVELYALLGRRVGMQAVAATRESLAPLLTVLWVQEELHERALDLVVNKTQAGLSLVDASCFVAWSDGRFDAVWAYDRHFEVAGFPLLEA